MVQPDWPLITMAVISISILLFCGRYFIKAYKQNKRYKAERDAANKECERWKKRYYVLKDGKY